jgi:hypothetical protein
LLVPEFLKKVALRVRADSRVSEAELLMARRGDRRQPIARSLVAYDH